MTDAEIPIDPVAAKAEAKLADLPSHTRHTDPAVIDKKRAVIEAALARARERRDQKPAKPQADTSADL